MVAVVGCWSHGEGPRGVNERADRVRGGRWGLETVSHECQVGRAIEWLNLGARVEMIQGLGHGQDSGGGSEGAKGSGHGLVQGSRGPKKL